MIIPTCIWPSDISRDLQRFCKEVLVAKQVKNDNVMAIMGVQMTDQLCIVSEWMENGHMLTYLAGNEDADRIELVSLRLHPWCPLSDSF
jgi:hypothetical protein